MAKYFKCCLDKICVRSSQEASYPRLLLRGALSLSYIACGVKRNVPRWESNQKNVSLKAGIQVTGWDHQGKKMKYPCASFFSTPVMRNKMMTESCTSQMHKHCNVSTLDSKMNASNPVLCWWLPFTAF